MWIVYAMIHLWSEGMNPSGIQLKKSEFVEKEAFLCEASLTPASISCFLHLCFLNRCLMCITPRLKKVDPRVPPHIARRASKIQSLKWMALGTGIITQIAATYDTAMNDSATHVTLWAAASIRFNCLLPKGIMLTSTTTMHRDTNSAMWLLMEKILKDRFFPIIDFPFRGPSW